MLDWIYKLLKPGGKAFITLNTKTLIQNTDKSHMNSIYTKDGTQTFNNNMKQYILDQCEKSPLNFIVCDIFKGSLHEYVYGAGVSGTVRLIAQKD